MSTGRLELLKDIMYKNTGVQGASNTISSK